MERRICKSTGLSLPILGIGCWAFGGGDYWGVQEQFDVNAVVNQALDRGINFFDTAEAYNEGRSEEALGIALQKRREEALICTKIPPAFTDPTNLRKHCESSLKRLRTDWIDLYMIHWPVTDRPIENVLETLSSLKNEGKIHEIGLSNFGVKQLTEVISTKVKIACNELCYNLLSRAIEYELMPLCDKSGIGILAYMPLLQGLLTGKFKTFDEMPSSRTRTRHFRGNRVSSRHGEAGVEVEMMLALEGIRQISQELQISMTQLALAWIVSRPEITCVLTGIRSVGQLEECQAGVSRQLSPDVINRLDRLTLPIKEKLGSSPDYYQASAQSRIF